MFVMDMVCRLCCDSLDGVLSGANILYNYKFKSNLSLFRLLRDSIGIHRLIKLKIRIKGMENCGIFSNMIRQSLRLELLKVYRERERE